MRRRQSQRNPVCSIVPPHLLDEVAQSGSLSQRSHAVRTLNVATTFRSARMVAAAPERLTGASYRSPRPAGGPRMSIFDAREQAMLPGKPVYTHGTPAGADVAVQETYLAIGAWLDLFRDIFNRDSIDGHGLPVAATVHFNDEFNNVLWDGVRVVIGDGDGDLFTRFTTSVDVIGHELTHGLIQYTARLDYRDQPGALSESIADVFGSLVKQRLLGQTAVEADWLIGAGLFSPKVRGVGLRSLKAPGTGYADPILGTDPQPDHMSAYNPTLADNGGVHINCGIPNRAFYLTALALGGFAWERAGRIWYDALSDPGLTMVASFQEFAALTLRHAQSPAERAIVREGWSAVGIDLTSN